MVYVIRFRDKDSGRMTSVEMDDEADFLNECSRVLRAAKADAKPTRIPILELPIDKAYMIPLL